MKAVVRIPLNLGEHANIVAYPGEPHQVEVVSKCPGKQDLWQVALLETLGTAPRGYRFYIMPSRDLVERGPGRCPKLKPGALTIDLETGGIYGDLAHCPREDLLESAEALLSLLPRVKHKGLWGISKSFDTDCYLLTAAKSYQAPDGLSLEADIYRGPGGLGPYKRPFKLVVFAKCDREQHFKTQYSEPLVGSVVDGKVTPDTEGIPDLWAEKRTLEEAADAIYQETRAKELSRPVHTRVDKPKPQEVDPGARQERMF